VACAEPGAPEESVVTADPEILLARIEVFKEPQRTRCEGWVGLVVVSLDVCICHRLVQARDDWLNRKRWLMCQSIREDVTCSDFDSLFKKIVFQHDETVAHRRSIADNVFPIVQHLLNRNQTSVNIEVCKWDVTFASR
jgi:hypothetical protein